VAALSFCAPGCVTNVPRLAHPLRIVANCGQLQPRMTGIQSIMASTDDQLVDETPAQDDIRAVVHPGDGALAYWNAQPLALPRVSQTLGETDGYARVDELAITPAVPGALSRRIYLLVRDHAHKRWIAMNAFDTQSVCVEGRRDI